jgi:hypothetical protein
MSPAKTPAQPQSDDDRVTCTTCRNYRPGQCIQWRQALLLTREIGPALAQLPQRCPAFVERADAA